MRKLSPSAGSGTTIIRINLDSEAAEIRRFIEHLPLDAGGVQLELEGRTLCTILPPSQCSEEQKRSLIQERWDLIAKAQARNAGTPSSVIDADILEAVDEVRRS